MYRTDKQFMTNPATAGSRIYIGGLAKTIIAADLEEKFQPHGKILGLVLQMGFAFIQFENEAQAHSAIKNESNTILHGRKIIVKQALDKSQKGGNNQNFPNQAQNRRPILGQSPFNPAPKEEPKVLPLVQDTEPQDHFTPSNKPDIGTPQGVPIRQDLKNEPPLGARNNRKGRNQDRFPQPQQQNELYREEPYYGREEYSSASYRGGIAGPKPVEQQDRNDCEIIVVSKPLTKYAEYIESKLKGLGLIVDLLFPNDDVPIGRVLANISSRGCLYAILIMPQNEEHRSLTLNVLHGLPQEHRNMPIEDALILISRNFDAYMRGDKTVENKTPGVVTNVADRHPSSMQLVLNLLAENRQITTSQYDKILLYLQDRRELQRQHEVAEGVDQASQESNSKQAELQSRIMNILNKSTTEQPPPPVESTAPKDVAPPLLKDPSVQRALDSLLGGEMFKSIGAM